MYTVLNSINVFATIRTMRRKPASVFTLMMMILNEMLCFVYVRLAANTIKQAQNCGDIYSKGLVGQLLRSHNDNMACSTNISSFWESEYFQEVFSMSA